MPSVSERIKIVCVNILPMGIIVFMVVGFIILGWATPTEAAAFGVLGVIVVAAGFRVLSFESIRTATHATVKVAAMVFFIMGRVKGYRYAVHVYGCDIDDAHHGADFLSTCGAAGF